MTRAASSEVLVGEHYALLSSLGASDVSEVYTGLDRRNARACAVKLLSFDVARYEHGLQALQQADQSAALLRLPAIVSTTDFGLDRRSGRPFVITEHVELPSLSTLINTRGALPLSIFGEGLQAIGSALEAAIGIHLAHGSLKPQNLFLSPERPSIAKVSDFGISRLRLACPPPLGPSSLGWTSPEALEGAEPSLSGDVFSLGLTAFYALVGRHYLRAMWQRRPEHSEVYRELTGPHPRASQHARALNADLPAALDDWFACSLARNPSQRFANARDAVRAFEEVSVSSGRISRSPKAAATGIATGIAAAIAAPSVFQDLPRVASAHDGVVPQAPSLFGTPNSYSTAPSHPPESARPAANPEHVAGLPSRPPLAPLAVVLAFAIALVGMVALSAWGLSKLF